MKLDQIESGYAKLGGGGGVVWTKDARVNGINLPDAAAAGTRDANSFWRQMESWALTVYDMAASINLCSGGVRF